jgi:hypothetical protein
MNPCGIVTFALGLMVTFGLVVYATWLALGTLIAAGSTTPHAEHVPSEHGSSGPGSALAFDQLWAANDGNTIVAGAPTVGTSAHTGEPVIQVPVTLTNTTERDWSPVSTTFVGTLNHAPVAESAEGDWMYRAPIAAHTSVTLTKVFVGGRGQFTLTVQTPHGVALFTGRI